MTPHIRHPHYCFFIFRSILVCERFFGKEFEKFPFPGDVLLDLSGNAHDNLKSATAVDETHAIVATKNGIKFVSVLFVPTNQSMLDVTSSV